MSDEIDKEIDKLYEEAEQTRYCFLDSFEVIGSITGWWFLGESLAKQLAKVAYQYIASAFLMRIFALIYESSAANKPARISLRNLADSELRGKFLEAIGNSGFKIEWLENTLFPACIEILKYEPGTLEDIARIGNLSEGTYNLAYKEYEAGNKLMVMDAIWQFKEILDEVLLGIHSQTGPT